MLLKATLCLLLTSTFGQTSEKAATSALKEELATVTSDQRSNSSPNPTSNVLEIFKPKIGSNKSKPTKQDWNETETERSNIFEDSTTREAQDITAACSDLDDGMENRTLMKKLVSSSRQFSPKFRNAQTDVMGIEEHFKNQLWSPFSVMSAIGMLLLGSRGNTRSQIKDTVFSAWNSTDNHLEEPLQILQSLTKEVSKPFKRGNDTLSVANQLFFHDDLSIDKQFVKETKDLYCVDPTKTDFGESKKARIKINNWVERKTKNNIENVLPQNSLSSKTKLVLVSAIHFLGSWKHAFNSSWTTKSDFHSLRIATNETIVKVDMMSQEGNFTFCKLDGIPAEMLKLDYTDERFSMFIILPDKIEDTPEIVKSFQNFTYDNCKNNTRTVPATISVPKFEFQADFKLRNILSKAGMADVFNGNKANLSGISNKTQLFVDEFYHKAIIKVNEERTEESNAAATEETKGKSRQNAQEPKVFKCDRTFIFVIVENKFGGVLFEGYVNNPRTGIDAKA